VRRPSRACARNSCHFRPGGEARDESGGERGSARPALRYLQRSNVAYVFVFVSPSGSSVGAASAVGGTCPARGVAADFREAPESFVLRSQLCGSRNYPWIIWDACGTHLAVSLLGENSPAWTRARHWQDGRGCRDSRCLFAAEVRLCPPRRTCGSQLLQYLRGDVAEAWQWTIRGVECDDATTLNRPPCARLGIRLSSASYRFLLALAMPPICAGFIAAHRASRRASLCFSVNQQSRPPPRARAQRRRRQPRDGLIATRASIHHPTSLHIRPCCFGV
jgi:hypothetical protein